VLELIASNLRLNLGRTVLTALGIGFGVAVITSLLAVTAGLKQTAASLVHLGGSDLGVFQKDISDPTASVLPVSLARDLERVPDVLRATPVMLIVGGVPHDLAAVAFGVQPDSFFARRAVLVRGRQSSGQAVIIGDALASQLHLRPASTVSVNRHVFHIAGVYHTGISPEDSGLMMHLAVAQQITGRLGEATTIPVQLRTTARASHAGTEITRTFPGTQVISDSEEAARAGANNVLIGKAVDLIVVLALIVGGITVTNTVAMSVLERQSELALLRVVGWSNWRISALVLGEGTAISLIGAGVGLLLGVVGSQLLVDALSVGPYVSPSVDAWDLGKALLIGIAIGVLGGIYPAWRVTRIRPATALARA
jgi:putative ABC transport system permease protein